MKQRQWPLPLDSTEMRSPEFLFIRATFLVKGFAYSIAALVICGLLPSAHANYVEDYGLKKLGLLL
jgi:hypothetical protein